MKKDWNSHIRAKNPIDVPPAEPAPEVSSPGAGASYFCFNINRLVKSLDSGPGTHKRSCPDLKRLITSAALSPDLNEVRVHRNDEIISNFKAFFPPENPFHHPAKAGRNALRVISGGHWELISSQMESNEIKLRV